MSHPAGPIPESYWVLPGKLCAGEYPYARDPDDGLVKLAQIRAAGIDTFIDLTEAGEYGLRPYRDQLGKLEYVRLAIRDEDVPTKAEMRTILDTIDDALERGRAVYLHCWGGHGRTGTVVGCYLVRHGASPPEALASIVEWRSELPDSERPSPATAEQRRFVEDWQLTEAVARASRATAAAMSALGGELATTFAERDLQGVFVVALRRSVGPLKLKVKPDRGVDFAQWQPRVGPVDVALGSDANAMAPAAFIELKWGSGTLYNCVWDVAKMAVAVAGGSAPRAYLIAGAPTTEWEGGAEGSELFTTDAWQTKYLLENYAHRWKFWRCDVKTRPVSLPLKARTEALESAEMTIGGARWTLRCAEVMAATDTVWLDMPTNYDSAV